MANAAASDKLPFRRLLQVLPLCPDLPFSYQITFQVTLDPVFFFFFLSLQYKIDVRRDASTSSVWMGRCGASDDLSVFCLE